MVINLLQCFFWICKKHANIFIIHNNYKKKNHVPLSKKNPTKYYKKKKYFMLKYSFVF